MEMITEEDKQFSWDDVYGLLGGVIAAFLVIIRQMDDIPGILFALFGIGYIIKALALIL